VGRQALESQLRGTEIGSPLIDSIGEHHDYVGVAARYLVILGLLAEAEGGPLRIAFDRRERRTRHVYVGDRPARPREAPSSAPAAELAGRTAEQRPVSGHLKHQHHGEGQALVKWTYVEQHEARRWFASRVVSGVEEQTARAAPRPIDARSAPAPGALSQR
jgi:hypothetical protein